MSAIPEYAEDIFAEDIILAPYDTYQRIRDLGPLVRLTASDDVVAVGRFADVNHILGQPELFTSGQGVGFIPKINKIFRGSTIGSVPPIHGHLRRILIQPMMPKNLAPLVAKVQAEADRLVDDLLQRKRFDGVADLASHLPVAVVSMLVGLPPDGREKMLDWAAANFNAIGPANDRALGDMGQMMEFQHYLMSIARKNVVPDSWVDLLFDAVDRGDITDLQMRGLIGDYTAPSLDTTIGATGHLMHLLGTHPEVWQQIRCDHSLIRPAIEEALRLEAPIRGFTRVATEDTEVAGIAIPKDTRLFPLYASANRDERFWEAPERFDLHRENGRKHLGFGYGIHQCVGQHLARMEMTCLMTALVQKVEHIQAHPPVYAVNNMLRVLSKLSVEIS